MLIFLFTVFLIGKKPVRHFHRSKLCPHNSFSSGDGFSEKGWAGWSLIGRDRVAFIVAFSDVLVRELRALECIHDVPPPQPGPVHLSASISSSQPWVLLRGSGSPWAQHLLAGNFALLGLPHSSHSQPKRCLAFHTLSQSCELFSTALMMSEAHIVFALKPEPIKQLSLPELQAPNKLVCLVPQFQATHWLLPTIPGQWKGVVLPNPLTAWLHCWRLPSQRPVVFIWLETHWPRVYLQHDLDN